MMMQHGCFLVKTHEIFNMTNFDRDESVMKFARQLRGMGVDEALRARGAKDGDLVRIGKFEFEFVDQEIGMGDKPISFRDADGNFVSAADVWNERNWKNYLIVSIQIVP